MSSQRHEHRTDDRPHPTAVATGGAASTDFPRAVPVVFENDRNDDGNNNLVLTTKRRADLLY
jgi:hypothetical protein